MQDIRAFADCYLTRKRRFTISRHASNTFLLETNHCCIISFVFVGFQTRLGSDIPVVIFCQKGVGITHGSHMQFSASQIRFNIAKKTLSPPMGRGYVIRRHQHAALSAGFVVGRRCCSHDIIHTSSRPCVPICGGWLAAIAEFE